MMMMSMTPLDHDNFAVASVHVSMMFAAGFDDDLVLRFRWTGNEWKCKANGSYGSERQKNPAHVMLRGWIICPP